MIEKIYNNVNPCKLQDELIASGIIMGSFITFDLGNDIAKIQFPDDVDLSLVETVVSNHDKVKLLDAKEVKVNEIRSMCSDKMSTFSSSSLGVIHLYSYDEEAKDNLKDTIIAITSNMFPDQSTVNWRIHDTRELIPHNKSQLITLYQDSVQHKQVVLAKFRNLEFLVNQANTIEEVNKITWDTVIG